jgi:hypothetical protein
MQESIVIDGIKEYTLDSWTEFFALLTDTFLAAPMFVFRGQANYSWALCSSLDRHEQNYPKRKKPGGKNTGFFECTPFEDKEHLAAFRRAIRGRRGPNPPELDDDECWALGQHHGLRTPLLDWTRAPFAALFFAFEEEEVRVDQEMRPPDYRGVFALSAETISSPPIPPNENEKVTILSPEGDANYRLISQAALFVKMPRHTDLACFVRAHFAGESRGATLTKVKIPNEDRHGCLVALNKMNINHMTLFPDIDGAAKHVNSLWQPGHEDSLAYV